MKMHNRLQVLWMLLILMVPMLLMVSVANAQPANDDFDNAIELDSLPYKDSLDTSAAKKSPDDPSNCDMPSNTVWYKGRAGANQVLEADTFESDYDTILTVVTGSPGSFTLVACNDDSGISGSENKSQVIFNADAGKTYYFMVGSKKADGGSLVFNVKNFFDDNSILVPTENEELQGVVVFKARLAHFTNMYTVDLATVSFNVREPELGEAYGKLIQVGNDYPYEGLPASKKQSGYWEHSFDTAELPDGDYLIFDISEDTNGATGWSPAVPFIISNEAPPTTTTTTEVPTTTTTVTPPTTTTTTVVPTTTTAVTPTTTTVRPTTTTSVGGGGGGGGGKTTTSTTSTIKPSTSTTTSAIITTTTTTAAPVTSTTTTTIKPACTLTVENSFLPLRAGLFARLGRIVIKGTNSEWDKTSQVTIDDINTLIHRVKDQETIIAWIIIPGKLIAKFEPGTKVVRVQMPGTEDCAGDIVIE